MIIAKSTCNSELLKEPAQRHAVTQLVRNSFQTRGTAPVDQSIKIISMLLLICGLTLCKYAGPACFLIIIFNFDIDTPLQFLCNSLETFCLSWSYCTGNT